MRSTFDIKKIKEYWAQQALVHKQSCSASWSDRYAIELEVREFIKHLENGDMVLDVGCANGFSIFQYAGYKEIKIRGIEVIPEMIEQAQELLWKCTAHLQGQVEFAIGDATALDEPDDHYDKVIVTRVIINLETWENQQKGLRECVRVLKPGGILLLSEATQQGLDRLNSLRRELGFADISIPKFNLYLDQERVVQTLEKETDCLEIVDFASTYYLGTRVIKPLLARIIGDSIKVADPESEINRLFSRLPAWGDYGTQKLFVFQKR